MRVHNLIHQVVLRHYKVLFISLLYKKIINRLRGKLMPLNAFNTTNTKTGVFSGLAVQRACKKDKGVSRIF
jgi:hypothetical protein